MSNRRWACLATTELGSSQSVLMAQLSVVPNSFKFHSLPNDEEAIFGIGAGWLWNAMCGFGMGNSSKLTLFQIDRPKYHAWLELRKRSRSNVQPLSPQCFSHREDSRDADFDCMNGLRRLSIA